MKRKKNSINLALIIGSIFLILIVCFFIYAFYQREVYANRYDMAQELIAEEKYEESLSLLDKLIDYKDSDELKKKAEKGIIYLDATKLLNNKKYEEAIEKFEQIKGFKDSTDKIKEATYKLALEYYENKEYDSSRKLFAELEEYKDSEFYLAQIDLKNLEKSKKVIYEKANSHLKTENYAEALDLFKTIVDYKDSKQLMQECKSQMKRRNPNNVLAAGVRYSVAITEAGNVKAVGDGEEGQCEVSDWKNIVSVDAFGCLTIGLKDNGKVEVAGKYDGNQTVNIKKWSNIIDVAAGERFVVGLKDDGTVVAAGHGDDHQLDVEKWKNVTAIDAGWRYTVALTKNKELLFAGIDNGQREQFEREKDDWKNVVNIAAAGGGGNSTCRGKGHTVGLKSDGTVVAVGDNNYGQCEVSDWENIVKVAAGDWYTVGLKKNGEIEITGSNYPGTRYIDEEIIEQCNNIVDIAAGFGQTLCLNKNGTVTAFGFDEANKYSDTLNWNNLMIP